MAHEGQGARAARRWLIGYLAVQAAMLPAALPLWRWGSRYGVERWLSIEAIHVAQYAGLGALGAWCVAASVAPSRLAARLGAALAAVGVLDEMVQALLPRREFQWSDIVLNWLGLAMGMMLFGAGRRMNRVFRKQ